MRRERDHSHPDWIKDGGKIKIAPPLAAGTARTWGIFFAMAMLACGASCLATEERDVNIYGLDPPVLKPSGQEFKFWRNETTFARTYHVNNRWPKASDDNPGTEELPFKTIGRAAALLEPGQRVIVHAGTYRECIRPARGGTSPSRMIGYQADGEVIVKGSEAVGDKWVAQDAAGIWAMDLKTVDFGDYNPFALDNLPETSFDIMRWAVKLRGKLPYTLPRGLVFQAGQRLTRVANREELLNTEGSHWTDRQTGMLLVHTRGGKNPNGLLIEITTRRGCFRPAARGLGFIQVRGFVFEQVGNGFPRPQEGAISVCAGHHWLIEENTVRQVNGVGIDIGTGWYGGAVKPPESGGGEAGWNIVLRNHVSDTGVCGIAGIPCANTLIEENVLRNNTIYPVGRIYECAGIKTHKNQGTLIRRNIIMDNSVNGIWMDWDSRDSRCTQNVLVNCVKGIFLEASVVAPFCVLDRNVIWGAKRGICEHDSKSQTFVHNFLGRCETGIVLRGKITGRVVEIGHPTAGGGHTVANNAFFEVKQDIKETKKVGFMPNIIAGNASDTDGLTASLDALKMTMALATSKPLAAHCDKALVSHDLLGRPWPGDIRSPGPLPLGDDKPVEMRFDWWRQTGP
jgi:hypothetical protein